MFLSPKESWNEKPSKLGGWALKTRVWKHCLGAESSQVIINNNPP
jgi:hypothetical protein